MQLNEIIRRLRRLKEWSQQNLADELGIHITTLIRYEKDSSVIPFKEIEKLAAIFSMTPPELLSFDDEKISLVMEPGAPYGLKKDSSIKVIIELDGQSKTLERWYSKLQKINDSMSSV